MSAERHSKSESASPKALNNVIQGQMKSKSQDKQKSSAKWDWSEIEELRKTQLKQEQKIRSLDRMSSELSLNQSMYDNQIKKLVQLIEQHKLDIKNLKPKDGKRADDEKLLYRNDWLDIRVREWNFRIDDIETKFETLKKAHKKIVETLSEVHLKNEYQDTIDMIRVALGNTTNDYNEAKSLVRELQKIAWSMLPTKISQFCEEIERKMENLKFKYEEIRLRNYKYHMERSRMYKEIVAIDSALKGELRIQDLYAKKIEQSKAIRDELKEKLNKYCHKIGMIQKYLSMDEVPSNMMPKPKFSTMISVSKDSEDTVQFQRPSVVIGNEEKAEFLEEKLKQLNQDILSAKEDLKKQEKSYQTLKSGLSEITNMRSELKREMQARDLMTANLRQEVILRKTYYNQIEDLKGKIRVFCRCRPISQEEINRGNKQCVSFPDMFTVTVVGKAGKEYQFDKVFPPKTTQEIIFQDTSKLLQSAFDGFNVCIFAYGQTGSGKTFTLIGNMENNPGIVPRAFEKIFQIANEGKTKYKALIQCYMLELYNDKLLDLMTVGAVYSDKLEIKKDVHGMVIVPGAEFITAADTAHLKELFLKGSSNRHIASTKMNSESSRSHLIISLAVTCHIRNSDNIIRGKISIIDLAGSERVAKSGVQGVGAQEAMSINMSLSALGDVISALTTGQTFVPYRNNKLTMLMQDSIGGNAKTLMFVNISPVDYNTAETLSSLTYGARVKLIKNDTNRSVDPDEIAKLQKIIDSLLKGERVVF